MDADPLSCNLAFLATTNVAAAHSFIQIYAPSLGAIIAGIIAVLGLFASAFMSGSEIAYFSLTDDQIEGIDDAQCRDRIRKLLNAPEKLLATILIGNNLINVMVVVLSSFVMTQIFRTDMWVVDFIMQSVILTFLILLFGEIIPKLYANSSNVRFAVLAQAPLTALTKLFNPITKLMVKSTFIVNKMVTKHSDDLSMEDLSKALEKSDVKAEEEKNLLEGILKFGGTTVSEIMRPRIDVLDLDYDSTFDEVVKVVVESGYSRIPVFKETPDNIRGILYAKDLLPYIGKQGKNFAWQRLLREAYFVPEARMIDDLLEDFRKKKIHFAIVVDEFGGTQGIATLEDVLEEIVGEIDDEYDTEEKFYTKIADNIYIFDAKTLLNDFYRVTDISEDDFGDIAEDAETIAGLLLNVKCDFPKEKEIITYGNCKFTVLQLEKHRIVKVKVEYMPPKEENN